MRLTAAASAAAFVLLTASPVRGQGFTVPEFELERLELNPSGMGSLVVGTGELLTPRSFRITGAVHYERNPLLAYRNDVLLGAVVSDRFTIHLAAAYALHKRVELGMHLPVVAFQAGDDLTGGGISAPARAGLGSPHIAGRFALMRGRDGAPLDLAAQLGFGIPIGSGAALARNVGFSISPRLLASKRISRYMGTLETGAMIRPAVPLGVGNLGSELKFAGGLMAQVTQKLRAETSLRASISLSGEPTSTELLLGGRFNFLNAVDAFVLAGPGLGGAPGTPTFRVLFGAAYERLVPEAPVVVCIAGKPHDPVACPDLDLDGDGIRNADDKCPQQMEDADRWEDADGCPEPDNDFDTLLDDVDQCPNEKGLPERQGCPIPDRDRDTVMDDEDACPDEAGPVARKGCPFKDEDNDGIEDKVDACPKEAGPIESRGCPIKDSDEDTVADHVDNCPNEKGPPDNQGCPAKNKQLVVITRERLVIKDKVYFDLGKATLQKRSSPLLDQIANVLKEHPEITLANVEGHTDNRGSAELNRKLSQDRADAVRGYLIKQGVAPDRLQAKGYGPDRPSETNLTNKGREANRRVEFNIAPIQEPSAPEPAPSGGAAPLPTDGGVRLDGGTAPDAGAPEEPARHSAPDAGVPVERRKLDGGSGQDAAKPIDAQRASDAGVRTRTGPTPHTDGGP